MTPRSAKAKGRRFEMEVAQKIREALGLPERCVLPTPMGQIGTDIKLSEAAHAVFPYSPECKNVELLNIWSSWQQALTNTHEGDETVLFVRRNKTEPLAVVRLDHFLDLVRQLNVKPR